MRRILHALPGGYQRPIVDLTQEGLEGWDVELKRKDNDSGELKFTIGNDNPEFDGLCTMRSELIVVDGERELWRGRVTDQQLVNHWQKKIVCKGVLDYLYDAVIQPQMLEGSAGDVLTSVIKQFNESKIEAHKRFTVGFVGGIDNVSYEIKKPTKCFKVLSALVKELGGRLKAYRDGEKNMIDWRGSGVGYRRTCSQRAIFGKNVAKIEVSVHGDDIATALIGCGKDDLQCYISDDEAAAQFGVIEDSVSFVQVEDAEELEQRTKEKLQERLKEVRSITATVLDLSTIDATVEPFEEGCYVNLISEAHGIDEIVTVEEIRDPLFRPSKMQITLGASLETASNIMRRVI